MANNPLWYDADQIVAANALTAELNNGFINIYSGGQPSLDGGLTGTLLVQLTFGATAFAAATASGGVITSLANAITNGTAVNTGAAGYFAAMHSDNTTVCMTGTCGLSGADMNMSTTAIVAGAVISCSSFSIAQVQNPG